MAFTCTPFERPCVASNRFEMNWNSAIESWLKRGWPSGAELGRDLLSVEIELKLARLAVVPVRQRRGGVGRGRAASRRQQRQRHPVAAGNRQLLHLLRIDVAAERRRRDVQQRRFSRHGHRLLHGRRRHLQVDRGGLADEQLHAGARHGGEAVQLRGDPVGADARGNADRCRCSSVTPSNGCRSLRDAAYGHAGQHGAGGIGHGARQHRFLRCGGCGHREHGQDQASPPDEVRCHEPSYCR